MHYSAQSPVFQAFELTTRKLTGRFGRHDKQNPTFCLNCHSPTSSYASETFELKPEEPSINKLSALSKEGIHCTMCHSVRGPDFDDSFEKGALGDSIANATHSFFPHAQLVGPTTEGAPPEKNSYHTEGFWPEKDHSAYLRSAQFCGACHDVRVPNTPDTLTGKPFQRIENLFTEWAEGPYNSAKNPHGKAVSCTDCHMSLYGMPDPQTGKPTPPGVYPKTTVGHGAKTERRHALHAFTAVSVSLMDPKNTSFPSAFTAGKDRFGFPRSQQDRRQQMLRQACRLSWGKTPESISGRIHQLPLEIVVENTGAGHKVPSGFSQEREVWLHLKVKDADGTVVYESGALQDRAHPETNELQPDGRLYDEDLQDSLFQLDPKTLEAHSQSPGPDFNFRPFASLGLPTFHNAFMRKKSDRSFERVHFFTLANHMDNDRALPMLKPVSVRYDIPLSRWLSQKPRYCGPVEISVKLLYRTLPPKLFRALIQREPQILNEAQLDRNTIVEMAAETREISVCGTGVAAARPSVAPQSYAFDKNALHWLAFTQPQTRANAIQACAQQSCQLPTPAQYDTLGLADYPPQPGDNKDELVQERWTSASEPMSYLFTAGKHRVAPVAAGEMLKLPFFCFCENFQKTKENP